MAFINGFLRKNEVYTLIPRPHWEVPLKDESGWISIAISPRTRAVGKRVSPCSLEATVSRDGLLSFLPIGRTLVNGEYSDLTQRAP